MHAVLIEVDVAGVDREDGIRMLCERIVPSISQLPGFRSGTWLTGNEDGRGLSLTVWETEEDARAMAERFGGGTGPAGVPAAIRCEVREVAALAAGA